MTDLGDTDRLINLIHRKRDLELWKAVALAPSIQVCEALLRGEDVPTEQLDPVWAKALGTNART